MRVQFLQSFDFNQMLVFSVFVHLLFLTAALFLPKPTFSKKTVVPAFMVNLVSEPTGFKVAASEPLIPKVIAKKAKAKKIHAEKKIASKKPVKKSRAAKLPAVKKPPAIKIPKPNKALEALKDLEEKVVLATPNLVEELDQLARLEKPKIKPNVSEPVKKKSIAKKIFQELRILRDNKINDKKIVTPVPPHEDILENFEDLKMKESVSEVPVSLEKKQEFVPPVPRHEDILENFEDLKMKESVSEVPVSLEKKQEFVAESKSLKKSKIPKEDLLKELEQLAKLDASYVLVPDVEKEEAGVEEKIQKGGESFDSVIKKLGSFSIDSEPVKVEISITQLDSSDFQSNLRNLPQVSQSAVDLGAGNSFVGTKKEGLPGADIQSLYVGKIRKRIMKNWREPLAQEYNQESVISFFIFRGGNIDKPHIKRSSGVKELDTLAVRAVLDSVPFPEFPKDLKASNLHLEMYFKYVPKDE